MSFPCPNLSGGYDVARNQQFTFSVDDTTAACVFNDIANAGVNIRACMQLLLKNGNNLYKIVPGKSFGFQDDFCAAIANPAFQTANDLAVVRRALRKYCIKYCEEETLLVSTNAVPGQIRRIQALLNSVHVKIIALYIDESTFTIYQVSNNEEAEDVLHLSQAKQDEILEEEFTKCVKAGYCHKCRCKCKCKPKPKPKKHCKKDNYHEENY